MINSLAHWFADGADARKLNRVVLAVLVVLPLVIFGPSINYEFVEWDDDVNITANPHVRSVGWTEVKWMFTDVHLAHRYMPLGWLCYAVERTLWVDNPLTFHLGNLLLHAVNGLLLFSLLKRILPRSRPVPDRISARVILAAGMGALFWSLHPLRAEVVSWCASRIYLMATLWFMLSLWCYLQGASGNKYSAFWRWAAVGLFIASLLTYPLLLFGAVIFVLLDIFVLHRIPKSFAQWLTPASKRVWLEKLPFFLCGVICLGVTLATRTAGQQRGYVETLEFFDLTHRIAQGFYAWAYYAWIHWWPFDLAPRYGALLSFNPTEPRFLVSLALVVGLTGLLLWQTRRWFVALGLWMCHLILYFPFIGLTEHPHSTYDRYTYIPGMLWAAAISATLWKIWPHLISRYACFGSFGVVGCGLIVLSSQQTLVWQNTATVRLRIAKNFREHPDGAVHEEIAGRYFLKRGDLEPARACFLRALRLDPEDVDSRIYLGDTLVEMGRAEDALVQYTQAVQAKSRTLKARHNLGVAFCKLGRYQEGAALFKEILKEDPGHANASHNLTLALQKLAAGGRDNPSSALTQETGLHR